MLKEVFYTGLGGAVLLKEKVEEGLKELQEKGKLSHEEIKSFLDNAKTKGETEEGELREKLKTLIKEVLDEIGIATKSDIDEIKQKLS